MFPLNTRQGMKSLLPVLVSILFVACSSLPDDSVEPVKSANDEKQYRLITLDNELEVLLISDPDTRKAAAALDVMVGSGDNPEGREGLAHFLEHMLFLGTDKYPDAAEYEEYTTEHGGSRNAYTSFDHTNYFFDIDEAYLPEALDRFAQFFIAPRFDEQYVDREKNAVQAEYQMGLKNDARRAQDVLREVVNPEHSFSQFAVGSLDTLADRPGSSVRDDLLAFYDKHYSANQMKLTVLGSESLDELEALVRPMFSEVPNKAFQYSDMDASFFAKDSLPMMVQVKPQATMRQLQVTFPIADYRNAYRAKPLSYLGNLVGHEGEGSLLSQLKARGLAEGLGAGSGMAWRGGGLFSVNVSLTEKGVEDYETVLQLLFAYLDMLREEGPKAWLYDEQAQLAELNFRFRGESDPIRVVMASATGMHTYQPEDVIRGPYLMKDYDEAMLSELIQGLVPGNALVTLSDMSVETDRTSAFYQVPYSVSSVSPQQLARWSDAEAGNMLALPAPNEFIAEDVDLKAIVPDNPEVPNIALQEGRQTIWFVQDEEFRRPKGAVYINFRSPLVGQDASQTATAVLYAALQRDAVNEFTYPAALAGLHFNLYKHAQGISLRINGYNDKQLTLLNRILSAIENPEFTEQRFTNIRLDMIRALQNVVAQRPSSQVIGDLNEALLYGEWGEQALIDVLQKLTLADVESYAKQFWSSAQAETLIYGNYDPSMVDDVSRQISKVVPDGDGPALQKLRVLKLEAGESLQLKVDVPHDDSVVAWYLQARGDSWEDRAATALSAQIMQSGFFQQLRTEQQLGYIAQTVAWEKMGVPGLLMLIQSPTASAADVAAAMDTFIRGVQGQLTPEQFARHQQALLNEIRRPHKNMQGRAEFYWQSIARKQYDFDAREALASAVEELSMEQWSAYFTDTFLDHQHSLQAVATGRWETLPAGDVTLHTEAESVKVGHGAYIIE